ncbi:disease resistance protein Roq1-like [Gastrolobium bilobum]|uniref:disease resistance protein Roq1-like n=1 Tax=Gastrolobium bilobum TaxID=150636 RepID=UPI002AB1B2A8|nr:disease resistance protein Roq1-like [Gastrolobium bilobum]
MADRKLVPITASSSSVAVSPPLKYDVFLSFRGEDTREGFTNYLYDALCRKNIETFIDNSLVRGDEISSSLHQAIEESNIYVIIFSQHYASSTWCLDELTKILECKERYGRLVIPVFYNVDPSDVRKQRGSYADAFVLHDQRPNHQVSQRWKAALTEAAGLLGWDSKKYSPEYKLIEEIAKDILGKLKRSSMIDHQGLIGIHKHIAQIQSILDVESTAVRIIGIWGMGGIGKTTIAGAIYHKLATQFSCRCFVENVQEKIERNGIHHVQRKYLSELLEEKIPNLIFGFLKERLKRRKVLLILDNVNNSGQLNDLLGGHGSFGQGSRIILTSRDMQVLKNAKAEEIYEVKEMGFQDSLQLFSLNAFKQNYPTEHYMWLSEKVLNYAKGIPLALKVMGLLLYGRTKEERESTVGKLEKLPDPETFNVLKLSYDGLDDEQKDIFLDIACFYRGHDMNIVKQTLDSCGFSAAIGMRVLIDRGLISILKDKIVMHDLIQEMGQEIVRQQCVKDPGKRSRLWKHEDIYHVLRKNKGTDAVQCIFLDMCQIKEVQLHAQAFKMMDNLRLLQFFKSNKRQDSKVHIPSFLESFPDDLRFLRWDGFPQRSLPLSFFAENLVRLDMRDSHLQILWERDQTSLSSQILKNFLNKLNCLWLNGCVELRRLNLTSSVLSKSSGLIVLYGCCKLEMFSVSNATTGVLLGNNLRSKKQSYHHNFQSPRSVLEEFSDTFDPLDCPELNEEPRDNIHLLELKMLRERSASLFPSLNELCWLDLSYCESLSRTAIQELPLSLHHLVGLEELSLHRCQRLEFTPPSIGSLSKLCKLDLNYCESLETLPSSIFKLKLTKLDLYGCSMLRNFPEILEPAESFAHLRFTKTAIKEIPSSLEYLVGLQTLSMNLCRDLQFLPNSIGNLTLLSQLDFSGCDKLSEIPSDIGRLSLLRELSLSGSGIVNLPESIAHLSSLESLDLRCCKGLECIPVLPPFLKHLLAFDCPSVRSVSSSRFNVSSDSKEEVFKFHLTNSQELDPGSQSNIADDARLRILKDTYRSVFYFFPGSSVPHWFRYRCKGDSVTLNMDSLNWCNDNTSIGFALCFVLGPDEGMDHGEGGCGAYSYRFIVESDDGMHVVPIHDPLPNSGSQLKGDHITLWKCCFDSSSMSQMLSHVHNLTFEICKRDGAFWRKIFKVKECGISPFYSQKKNDNGGAGAGDCSNFQRFSNNDDGPLEPLPRAYKRRQWFREGPAQQKNVEMVDPDHQGSSDF